MQPINFSEATQYLGRPSSMGDEDCDAVPICRTFLKLPSGETSPAVVTCWEPTPEGREAIAAGANIYLHVLGPSMPPVFMSGQVEGRSVGAN